MSKKARLSGILSLVLVLSSCGFNDVIDVSYGSSDEHDNSSGSVANDAFYIEESYININYNLIALDTENYSYQLSLVKTGKYEGETTTYTFDPNYVENVSNDGLISFNMENFFSVKSFSVIASVEDGSSDYVLITFGEQADDIVQNVQYDIKTNLLTYGARNPGNFYVYVNGNLEYRGRENEIYIPLKSQHNKIEIIQSIASNVSSSPDWTLWSEPLIVDFDDDQDLIWKVNEFAQNIVGISTTLKKVISIHQKENNFYVTGIFEYGGVDRLYTWNTDYGQRIETDVLQNVLNMENPKSQTIRDSRYEIKNYDTASSFLKRQDNGKGFPEQIQSLVEEGYRLSFVTSQAYDRNSAVGLTGILRATINNNLNDTKYYAVDMGIGIIGVNSESIKFTAAVEQVGDEHIIEYNFIELIGDFAEYARQLDELMNQ